MIVPLDQKIEERMNRLEKQLKENLHLEDPKKVQITIDSISKFWSRLKEEDKDYIHMARIVLEEKKEWK